MHSLLLISLLFVAYCSGVQWSYGGTWAWSSGCDFWANDMGSAQTQAPECGPKCEATPGCSHFAWTPPSNCWLKSGSVSQAQAFDSKTEGIVCGFNTKGGGSTTPTTPPASSGYHIVQHFTPESIQGGSDWDFFTEPDPTHGYVTYVDRQTAINNGILRVERASNGQSYVYMGAKATQDRPMSIRVTSKRSFTGGLVIWDADHIPTGCGSWPAFWTFGPNWPNSGEIDVMEGVNGADNNAMTLHTKAGCVVNGLNCNRENAYVGCGTIASNSGTFGPTFNSNPGGGGVYAMEWVNSEQGGIKIWSFPRNRVPGDILSGNPNPSSWPTNFGHVMYPFGGNCPNTHFANHNIIINLAFCGDWAGAVFPNHCSQTGKSCVDYIKANPEALSEAYFKIYSVKLYQKSSLSFASADNSTVFVQDVSGASETSYTTATGGGFLVVIVSLLSMIGAALVVVIALIMKVMYKYQRNADRP